MQMRLKPFIFGSGTNFTPLSPERTEIADAEDDGTPQAERGKKRIKRRKKEDRKEGRQEEGMIERREETKKERREKKRKKNRKEI